MYKFIDTPEQPHLHTLDGKPLLGTSTVLNVLNKPGLTWWASSMSCESLGWNHPKENGKYKPIEERLTPELLSRHKEIVSLDVKGYLAELDNAYKAHAVKLGASAEEGTGLHMLLEMYVRFCMTQTRGEPIPASEYATAAEHYDWSDNVDLFSQWAVKNVYRFIASEAHCYSERLGTGGIVDLIYEDFDGNLVILDFKSSKDAYNSYFLQNGGYAIAIEENGIFTADGVQLRTFDKPFAKYAVLPFGMKNPRPMFCDDVERLKAGFECCVTLHKLFQSMEVK